MVEGLPDCRRGAGDCALPEMKRISLTKGQFSTVSDADYAWVSSFKWHAHKSKYTFYAARSVYTPTGKQHVYMHRMLLKARRGIQVDHRDGNGLNNCRRNLRLATRTQNLCAFRGGRINKTSKYRGVYFQKQKGKWQVRVIRKYVGIYESELDAAHAYDAAARAQFGEFVHLNFP